MANGSIQLTLTAEPLALAMTRLHDFKIGIVATNTGSTTLDPELHLVRLRVNGQDSLAWGEAIGNGLREAKWSSLPSGESVSMSWSTLGPSLLTAPGQYVLVLHHHGRESDPVRVLVRAT
jgi:hypothetical protein